MKKVEQGNEKPVTAGYRSIKLEMEPGEYWWCACGKSSTQPFCNGSHKGSSFSPVRVVIETRQLVKWCACKHTLTPPFCDHSHRSLEGYEPK